MASVSVVLPTRDRPEFLVRSLASAARQTHPEIELILVRDGGAPLAPEARRILDALEFPATLIERDGDAEGAARARNRGVAAARGEAVAFLDDDDAWERNHVARLAAALDAAPDLDVAYADALVVDEATGATRTIAQRFDLGLFGRDGFIPPSALLARRGAFDRFGSFDPEFTCSEDWDWLLRVARGGGRLARVPGASVTIHIHPGSLSALEPARLEERCRCLALLARRHSLATPEPKTFWEVAASLCPDPNGSTR